MGVLSRKREEERRRQEEEARVFRAAMEKISPRGHVDSEGRVRSKEAQRAAEKTESISATSSAARQNQKTWDREAMAASFFARSQDEAARREEERGKKLWALMEAGRQRTRQSLPGQFEVSEEQAAKTSTEAKQAWAKYFLNAKRLEEQLEEEKKKVLQRIIGSAPEASSQFGVTDAQAARISTEAKQGWKDTYLRQQEKMRAPNAYDVSSDAYYERVDAENRERLRHINDEANAVTARFGLTNKQAELVKMSMKTAQEPKPPETKNKDATIFEQYLETEKKLLAEEEANKQRGRAIIEKSQQSKEEERQQTAKERQIYEMYLPMSEERKANIAQTEENFRKAGEATKEFVKGAIQDVQDEFRRGKDERYLQEKVLKDVREEGYTGLDALYEASIRMAEGRKELDQWRHSALEENERLSFENPNNEDLIGKADYTQRVAQGALLNKFLQGGVDVENIAYAEGWEKSYLTDGSKFLSAEEIDRLSYYLSFSDDPMKKREAQDYVQYLENLAQRRYEYYRFLSGDMKNRGGEYGDAFISGGVEDSLQGIVSMLFEKPISFFTNRIAPTRVDTAEQLRFMQDMENETDPEKKMQKRLLQTLGAQLPYMGMGRLLPKMYVSGNTGQKAGRELSQALAKMTPKDVTNLSKAGYYGSMAASIYGNAEQRALLEGKNPQQAATYALLNTMSEVGLQAVVGRVVGIAGGARMQHSPMVQRFAAQVSKNPVVQRATLSLLRTGGENVEETLQMALQPAIANMAYGTNEKLNITKEEWGETVYVTTAATLLTNFFSFGLNVKNDVVTIRRDLRLPDGTYLHADTQNKMLQANALDLPFEKVLTEGEMKTAKEFAKNMDEGALIEMIEEAKRVAAFRFGGKSYGQILQEMQGKPVREQLQIGMNAFAEFIDEKRQTGGVTKPKANEVSNSSAFYKFTDVYKNAVNRIKDLLNSEFTPYQKQTITLFDQALPQTVALVKKELGIDISGYKHTMDQYSIQHSKNEHSDDKIPLKEIDYEIIPDVIMFPDAVYYAGKTRQGLDAIKYEKVIGNRLVYVEEVRTGQQNMHMTTTYWQPAPENEKAAGAKLQAEPADSPRALPRHRNSFKNNITQNDTDVNIQSLSESDINGATQDENVLHEDEKAHRINKDRKKDDKNVSAEPINNNYQSKKQIYKEIIIHGEIKSELDEVDLINKVIYENKSALNLYMENPDFPQSEEEWAKKQIFGKGKKRILALQQGKFTLSGDNAESLTTAELSAIRNFVFRIDADTSELRRAVLEQLEELKKVFPEYEFSATFGGEK